MEPRTVVQPASLLLSLAFSLLRAPHLSVALGGQLTLYGKPAFLTPIYGDHPFGGVVFLRFRPVSPRH